MRGRDIIVVGARAAGIETPAEAVDRVVAPTED
jgi:hypothetical protein